MSNSFGRRVQECSTHARAVVCLAIWPLNESEAKFENLPAFHM